MAKRNFDRNTLSQHEDWYGNNAALCRPVCGKIFVVSGFINRGQRRCPRCEKSTVQITSEQLSIEWPDAIDEPKIFARSQLESIRRLDEFVKSVQEGGAINSSSLKDKLPRAEKVAFIERDRKWWR